MRFVCIPPFFDVPSPLRQSDCSHEIHARDCNLMIRSSDHYNFDTTKVYIFFLMVNGLMEFAFCIWFSLSCVPLSLSCTDWVSNHCRY